MLRYLYYRLRYGSYLQHDHGIKKFAEMSMGQLTRKVTKKSAFYRESDEQMMVEKANLRMRENELLERPSLNAGSFFSVRRRLWVENALIVCVLVGAALLNFIALSAIIGGDDLGFEVLRWALAALMAVVLTGGGMLMTERLIESLLPERTDYVAEVPSLGRSAAPIWGVLLVAILAAILGISQVRASMLSAELGSSLLYFGFIVGSMILPLVAGALRWDTQRYIDVYKTTQTLREIEGRLAQIDSVLRQNEEFESNFYKIKSIAYWDRLNEFKTYKDNYNGKNGITENLRDHFARSYDTFQREATKRYESDVRDVTSTSMRRLESASDEGRPGSKLRKKGTPKPMPSAQRRESDEEARAPRRREQPADGSAEESDYMKVQPIR